MWKLKQDKAFHASRQDFAGSVSLFFWGTSITFPDWVLRTVEAEASAGQSIRITSLDEVRRCMERQSPDGPSQACAVFFDDTVADDVLTHFGSICEQVEVQNWVFAYRDPVIAQRLLTARQTDLDLFRILLLPMTVPISCWTPMLHLALAGNFFVPGDLVCLTETAPEPKSPPPVARGCPVASLAARKRFLPLSRRAAGTRPSRTHFRCLSTPSSCTCITRSPRSAHATGPRPRTGI